MQALVTSIPCLLHTSRALFSGFEAPKRRFNPRFNAPLHPSFLHRYSRQWNCSHCLPRQCSCEMSRHLFESEFLLSSQKTNVHLFLRAAFLFGGRERDVALFPTRECDLRRFDSGSLLLWLSRSESCSGILDFRFPSVEICFFSRRITGAYEPMSTFMADTKRMILTTYYHCLPLVLAEVRCPSVQIWVQSSSFQDVPV